MSNMTHSFLFPTIVWEKQLDYKSPKTTTQGDSEIHKHIAIKQSNEPTVHKSNYGGWQSESDIKLPFDELQKESIQRNDVDWRRSDGQACLLQILIHALIKVIVWFESFGR